MAIVVASCGSDEAGSSASDVAVDTSTSVAGAPAVTTTSDTVPATTSTSAGTTTTTVASTTPTTTAPPAPTAADLVLRSDGIGPLAFGSAVSDAVAVLDGALGPPTSDELGAYPTADGPAWANGDDMEFTQPYGRTVCYGNGLCAEFGADDPTALAFVGWAQDEPTGAAAPLQTADAITIESLWADHVDTMEVDEGGCYTSGTGRATGVELVVVSSGEPFGTFTEAGGDVSATPDPADVRVLLLHAGAQPSYLFADC